jgi:hypothetical protein
MGFVSLTGNSQSKHEIGSSSDEKGEDRVIVREALRERRKQQSVQMKGKHVQERGYRKWNL